jgi:type IV secretory pathway TraG/TraD family ATPase VirD4
MQDGRWKESIAFEEKDIVQPSDLMTLPETGEALLILRGHYARVKKVPYYKDCILAPKNRKIVAHNKAIVGEKFK